MKLLYVTNIPAPYRNKRYNMMQEIFPKLGIEFEVLYMAWKEPNRLWHLDLHDFKYQYTVFKGIHPEIAGMYAHFNPGLFFRLLKKDYDIAIIGGMGCPSHWFAPFFIPSSKIKVLSVETNLLSTAKREGIGLTFKKYLTRQYDAYQVTGATSKEYIQWLYPQSKTQKFITLPNLIDENIYVKEVNKARTSRGEIRKSLEVNDQTQLWICPARLEKVKGLHLFIPLLRDIKNVRLIIVGEGSLKDEFQTLIDKEELPVKLLGFKQQDEMIRLYAASDLFVLPSISDPSPLSPIEASASGLPLLVSERIGNFKDLLENNENGWGFNPLGDKDEIRKTLVSISQLSTDVLHEIGKNSYNRYLQNFETRQSIISFGNQLLDVFETLKQ